MKRSRVLRPGVEGFDDAVNVLVASLKGHNLKPDAFIAPVPGHAIKMSPMFAASLSPAGGTNYVGSPWI
jgi:hypothetical protein